MKTVGLLAPAQALVVVVEVAEAVEVSVVVAATRLP
jgi:hypothetical protein